MTEGEVFTWFQLARPQQIERVEDDCRLAWQDWGRRLLNLNERMDCASWSASGYVNMSQALVAASSVAGELAVLCMIWPAPMNTLRPALPNP